MVDVIRQDAEHDVGNGLHDLAIRETEDASPLKVGVADFAAPYYDAAREFQDGVDPTNRRSGVNRIGDVLFGKSDFLAGERVGTQAVAAQVALGDGEGDLLSDLDVEIAGG